MHKGPTAADEELFNLATAVQLHEARPQLRDHGHVVGLDAEDALHAWQHDSVLLQEEAGKAGHACEYQGIDKAVGRLSW